MRWLNKIVDEIIAHHPNGDLLIESGSSPSGTYHLGHLRELITADAIMIELRRRGRQARHVQFVDDFDALRKIPVNVPKDYEKFLGQPISNIPAPDGSNQTYADYFLQTLIDSCKTLGVEVEYVSAHQKYQTGFYVPAIECALENLDKVRKTLIDVSGRQLDDSWSPIQVLEGEYLRKRKFINLNKESKTLEYEDSNGEIHSTSYSSGKVKLDWRLDFPARWWLQQVVCEPSGRDHSTKGGSVETGERICRDIYNTKPPLAVPYDFINMTGDTKKMSASKGTGLNAIDGAKIMPPEVVRYFILRVAPSKRLFFDPVNGAVKLIDEFAAFSAKVGKNEEEQQLLYVCTRNSNSRTVSRIPFSHLLASYQASLKDMNKTLDVIRRTEYAAIVDEDSEVIKAELNYISEWLNRWAPEEVKFELKKELKKEEFSDKEKKFLQKLGNIISGAPQDADGVWYHSAIYSLKEEFDFKPDEMFNVIYRVLIGKTSGPRAGYFLSILPHEWLVNRLKMEE